MHLHRERTLRNRSIRKRFFLLKLEITKPKLSPFCSLIKFLWSPRHVFARDLLWPREEETSQCPAFDISQELIKSRALEDRRDSASANVSCSVRERRWKLARSLFKEEHRLKESQGIYHKEYVVKRNMENQLAEMNVDVSGWGPVVSYSILMSNTVFPVLIENFW